MKGTGIMQHGEEKAGGRPLLVFKCMKGWYRQDGGQLFSMCTNNRTRGSRLRLEYEGAFPGRDSC